MAAMTHTLTAAGGGDWGNILSWDTKVIPGFGGDLVDTVILPDGVTQALTTNLDRTIDGVHATETLTLAANAANGETVTINTNVYTFEDELTNVDGNVHVGADADESIDNLIAAINLGDGAGTAYAAATTLHATVTAEAAAGDTMLATARHSGTAANAYDTTETMGNGAWGAATLSGGTANEGLRLLVFQTGENYTPDIGGSGNELKLTVLDDVIHRGQGTLYLQAARPNGGRIGRTIIDAPFSLNANAAVLTGSGATGGGYAAIECVHGPVTIAVPNAGGAEAIQELIVSYSTNPSVDARVTVTSATGTIDETHINGGETVTSALHDVALTVSSGTLQITPDATWGAATPVYQTGGLVDYRTPASAAQGANRWFLHGGTFDAMQTTTEKQIGTLKIFPNAQAFFDDHLLTKTVEFVGVP